MGIPLSWNLYKPLIWPYIRSVQGTKNFPKDRPFIAVANHASYLDDFLVPYTVVTATDKPFSIFINSRFYKNPLTNWYLNLFYQIPVDVGKDAKDKKKRGQNNTEAMKRAVSWLHEGNPFIIFPEGTRSDDGKLKKGKPGAARLALLAKVPIVPIGVLGSYDILPKGKTLPRFGRVDIKVGKPISFKQYHGKHKDEKLLLRLTATIMKEIAALTGQRYDP